MFAALLGLRSWRVLLRSDQGLDIYLLIDTSNMRSGCQPDRIGRVK